MPRGPSRFRLGDLAHFRMSVCDGRDQMESWIERQHRVEEVLFDGSGAIPDRFGAAAAELWRFVNPHENMVISQNQEIVQDGPFQVDLRSASRHTMSVWNCCSGPCD